jgi:4-hydroxy 2-oxovalerate aldolase
MTQYLDCTIRDGGYLNDWRFTEKEVLECYRSASESGYDYFEIGFFSQINKDGPGKWRFCSDGEASWLVEQFSGCKISAMFSVSENEKIDLKKTKNIDLARVHYRIENKKNKELHVLCRKLLDCGMEVSLNLASSDKFDSRTINYVAEEFGNIGLKCIYLADTFGNLNEERTKLKLMEFKNSLSKFGSDTPMGFHAHDNMKNALAKSKVALDVGVSMLDSTILGLGRGAGNLRSEFFALDTQRVRVEPLLKFADFFVERHPEFNYKKKELLYAIASNFNVHPEFVEEAEYLSISEFYERIATK